MTIAGSLLLISVRPCITGQQNGTTSSGAGHFGLFGNSRSGVIGQDSSSGFGGGLGNQSSGAANPFGPFASSGGANRDAAAAEEHGDGEEESAKPFESEVPSAVESSKTDMDMVLC